MNLIFRINLFVRRLTIVLEQKHGSVLHLDLFITLCTYYNWSVFIRAPPQTPTHLQVLIDAI